MEDELRDLMDPDKMLDDLRGVGPDKPVGYLAVEDVGLDIDVLRRELEGKGLVTRVFEGKGWPGFEGALYVYDRDALAKLLEDNSADLSDSGWAG
jgi:hypothetical protein